MMIANARSVNVKRLELLTKLKANRDKHAAEYATAKEGYRMEVSAQLSKALGDFANDPSCFDGGLQLFETPPEDHTKDYDLAIMMMEMSTDETIHMDSHAFDQYVMDNWAWKQTFSETTSKYISNVQSVGRGK